MVDIRQKNMGKNGVEVIVFNGIRWLNQKNIEDQHSNLPAITLQYSSELRKQRQQLQNCGKFDTSLQKIFRRFCNSNNSGL